MNKYTYSNVHSDQNAGEPTMTDKTRRAENSVNIIGNFRNSLKIRDFYNKSTDELRHISTTQREAVDVLLCGLSAAANMAIYATGNKDYEEANEDLRKLSHCMTFTCEILHCFLYNSEFAEHVLRQRGDQK